MAADLERSKVACRVRLILWLPLFLINGSEIETQEWGKKINSVILFPLPFYRCRNKILLLWDSSFGSFSPPLMHSLTPSFHFSFLLSPYTFISLVCSGSFNLHSLAGRDFNEALVFLIFSLLGPQAFPHNNNNNNNNSEAISPNSCTRGTLTARKLV